ncbi:hypothetical protein GCM10018962_39000 [Dactylosporangium matsuzakiense]
MREAAPLSTVKPDSLPELSVQVRRMVPALRGVAVRPEGIDGTTAALRAEFDAVGTAGPLDPRADADAPAEPPAGLGPADTPSSPASSAGFDAPGCAAVSGFGAPPPPFSSTAAAPAAPIAAIATAAAAPMSSRRRLAATEVSARVGSAVRATRAAVASAAPDLVSPGQHRSRADQRAPSTRPEIHKIPSLMSAAPQVVTCGAAARQRPLSRPPSMPKLLPVTLAARSPAR